MEAKQNTTRQKWVDHTFNLGLDVGWSENVITRISDIAARCNLHCKNLQDDLLSRRIDNKWSIKEHIGHLIDLEDLHIGRLIEFKELKAELSAADMSNQKTESTPYNTSPLPALISRLAEERERLIETYRTLNTQSLHHAALHPRLKVTMRPVELLFFVGEHDDHHLTSIRELKRKLVLP